ncbi:MAG: hypothetical protein WAL31_07160 [Gaiellaceae bacterium]
MRRLTAWIGGVAGGIAAYRLWRRHSQPEPEPSSGAGDRAEELRTKLAQSKVTQTRTAEPVVEESPPEPAAVEEEPESPEDRRRRVHEEGRATLDDMKSD